MPNQLVSTKRFVKRRAHAVDGAADSGHDAPVSDTAKDPVERTETTGDRIRKLREAHNLNQRELSRLAKLQSQAHVGLLESSNRDSKVSTLKAIAAVLGTTVEYLITGKWGIADRDRYPHLAAAIDMAAAMGKEVPFLLELYGRHRRAASTFESNIRRHNAEWWYAQINDEYKEWLAALEGLSTARQPTSDYVAATKPHIIPEDEDHSSPRHFSKKKR